MRLVPSLVTLVVVAACGASCKSSKEISFDITVPNSLLDTAAWFEVGAFKDASCGALLPLLSGGIPDGAVKRVAFRRDAKESPRVGDLPRASYAFAAVTRADDCSIIATGCKEADVGDIDSVEVQMREVDTPVGACGVGASCQAARCVPANDNSDPSVGAGCSLELLGSGPLANPVGGGGTLVSAPAIAATANGGFIVVYREVDPNGAGARLTILPLDSGGGAPDPIRPGLPGRCANSDETDGIGIALRGDDGMISLARAPCGGKPALELLNFKATPEVGSFLVSPSPNDTRVLLSPAKPVAARTTGNVVVYTEGGIARIANLDVKNGVTGVSTAQNPTLGTFGGATSGLTDAWVAANDKILALLAAGKGDLTTGPPLDAGTEGGTTTVDAGGGDESTLRLLLLPASTVLTDLDAAQNRPRSPVTFPGTIGSLAATGARVLVISDGGGPGRSATFRAFDLNKDQPAITNGFSVDGQGAVTGVDAAVQGDRAYFVAMKPGQIALQVYGSATTTPTPLRNVSFRREPRISGVDTVRDGRIAVAATEKRVAVAWTTAKVLNNNDHTGGYAIFACTQ
jgi:hypothetical protein